MKQLFYKTFPRKHTIILISLSITPCISQEVSIFFTPHHRSIYIIVQLEKSQPIVSYCSILYPSAFNFKRERNLLQFNPIVRRNFKSLQFPSPHQFQQYNLQSIFSSSTPWKNTDNDRLKPLAFIVIPVFLIYSRGFHFLQQQNPARAITLIQV